MFKNKSGWTYHILYTERGNFDNNKYCQQQNVAMRWEYGNQQHSVIRDQIIFNLQDTRLQEQLINEKDSMKTGKPLRKQSTTVEIVD